MAQPTTFMLQHNNISQVNDIYYTNTITKKYLGYKYKFILFLKKILKFSFFKKYKIKLKILMLKSTQKKTFKFLKKHKKFKVPKIKHFNCFDKVISKINKKYMFIKFFFIKKLTKPTRKKRKFFRIKWLLKKKTLKKIFKKKYTPFSIGIIRLIKIKNVTFLNYILKKIKYKKYNKYDRFKIIRIKKDVFLKKKITKVFKKTKIKELLLNNLYRKYEEVKC